MCKYGIRKICYIKIFHCQKNISLFSLFAFIDSSHQSWMIELSHPRASHSRVFSTISKSSSSSIDSMSYWFVSEGIELIDVAIDVAVLRLFELLKRLINSLLSVNINRVVKKIKSMEWRVCVACIMGKSSGMANGWWWIESKWSFENQLEHSMRMRTLKLCWE